MVSNLEDIEIEDPNNNIWEIFKNNLQGEIASKLQEYEEYVENERIKPEYNYNQRNQLIREANDRLREDVIQLLTDANKNIGLTPDQKGFISDLIGKLENGEENVERVNEQLRDSRTSNSGSNSPTSVTPSGDGSSGQNSSPDNTGGGGNGGGDDGDPGSPASGGGDGTPGGDNPQGTPADRDPAAPGAEDQGNDDENQRRDGDNEQPGGPDIERLGFPGGMSGGARSLIRRAFESIYRVPFINRMTAKLGIAYNEIWMQRHEKKAAQKRDKVSNLDNQIDAIQQSIQEMSNERERAQQENAAGTAPLISNIRKGEKRLRKLRKKRDKAQSKFEKRDNKMSTYANRRDGIADKLIHRYDEKLRPFEDRMERQRQAVYRLEMDQAVMAERHDREMQRLDRIKQLRDQRWDNLRQAGVSERQANKSVEWQDDRMRSIRDSIEAERRQLEDRKARIDKQMARIDKKANRRRDIQDTYKRVKERRPLRTTTTDRERTPDIRERESVSDHVGERAGGEQQERRRESRTVSDFVENWNTYLSNEVGEDNVPQGERIDINHFVVSLQRSHHGLDQNSRFGFDNFERLLRAYFRINNVRDQNLEQRFNYFYDNYIRNPQ